VWKSFTEQNHCSAAGIRSAWGSTDLYDNDFIFNAYGSGWHVDRYAFDTLLARTAENMGAVFLSESVPASAIGPYEDGWQFETNGGAGSKSISSRAIVVATGRMSALACAQRAKRIVCDHLVGVAGFFSPRINASAWDSFTLIESVEDGWWYSASLPHGRAVAVYMTDGDLVNGKAGVRHFWERQVSQTKYTKQRLADHKLVSMPSVVFANSTFLNPPIGPNWVVAGDAAISFDPLSGQGVINALESGIKSAEAIQLSFSGKESALENYSQWLRNRFDGYLKMRARYYARESRWKSIFWRRRQAAQNTLPIGD
jgi:flavin-dependent dehydrogenase